MGQIDSFGEYTRRRLDEWGSEYALCRDFEYLGHASKNMLQILIDHRGEMPPPNVGYKPLEVLRTAQEIEDIIADVARDQLTIACVMRAMYCGQGRRKVERWETANLLIANMGLKVVTQRHYLTLHDIGVATVRGALIGIARAA